MPIRLPLWLYRVSGDSMKPTFAGGDVLLARRWFKPQVGQVVVAHRGDHLLVKRLARLDEAGAWLEGDNHADSTDSRQFGALPPKQIVAVVMCKL